MIKMATSTADLANQKAEHITALTNILTLAEKSGELNICDRDNVLAVITQLSIDIANAIGEAIAMEEANND